MVALPVRNRSPDSAEALERILLRHLAELPPHAFPGVEGMTTEDVLRDYDRWARQGLVPDRQQLLRLYPKLARELGHFFDNVTTRKSNGRGVAE